MSSFNTIRRPGYSYIDDPPVPEFYTTGLAGATDRINMNGILNSGMFNSDMTLSKDYIESLGSPDVKPLNVQKDGLNIGAGQVQGILNGLISGATALQTFKPKSSSEIIGDSGTSDAMAGGIGYTQQNAVNYGAQMQEQSAKNTAGTLQTASAGMQIGGSIGSAFGPVGGAIGSAVGAIGGFVTGLFKGNSAKRKLRRRIHNAQLRIDRNNRFNQAEAFTTGLQQDYAEEYGNTDGLLYANHGKDKNVRIKLRKRYVK